MAEQTHSIRFDRVAPGSLLGAKPIEVTPEGYKVYRGVAAFGNIVLKYPEFGRNEFVPAEEALSPEIAATLVGRPFTLHHPDDLLSADDPDAIKDHTEGTVLRAVPNFDADPPELVVDVMVWTETAQDAIESGRVRDLSPGYRCEEEPAPAGARHNGEPYSVIQRRRQYNHLSGVIMARGETPDGRRARLDATTDVASYARPVEDQDQIPEAMTETAVAIEPTADPAEALAMFSPEGAEILKSLPPADFAELMKLALIAKGEAAEQAVIAAGTPGATAVEVEEEDATAVAREREGIGEEMKQAAKAAEAEVGKDATTPAAPQALTVDAVKQMIADAIAAALPAKADAPPTAAPAATETDARKDALRKVAAVLRDETKMSPAEWKAMVEATVRAEQDFIAAVRRRGVRCDSVDAATTGALAVIKDVTPDLLAIAEDAARSGRHDQLLALFHHADNRRRDSLVADQLAAIQAVTDAEDEYRRDAVADGQQTIPIIDPFATPAAKPEDRHS